MLYKLSFTLGFPVDSLYEFLMLHAMCSAHLNYIFITVVIFVYEYKLWGSSLCNYLHPSATTIVLRKKYSPQHAVQLHPQLVFFPETNFGSHLSNLQTKSSGFQMQGCKTDSELNGNKHSRNIISSFSIECNFISQTYEMGLSPICDKRCDTEFATLFGFIASQY
jgi:hypothetical protein